MRWVLGLLVTAALSIGAGGSASLGWAMTAPHKPVRTAPHGAWLQRQLQFELRQLHGLGGGGLAPPGARPLPTPPDRRLPGGSICFVSGRCAIDPCVTVVAVRVCDRPILPRTLLIESASTARELRRAARVSVVP
jgi:hypothetical protein